MIWYSISNLQKPKVLFVRVVTQQVQRVINVDGAVTLCYINIILTSCIWWELVIKKYAQILIMTLEECMKFFMVNNKDTRIASIDKVGVFLLFDLINSQILSSVSTLLAYWRWSYMEQFLKEYIHKIWAVSVEF